MYCIFNILFISMALLLSGQDFKTGQKRNGRVQTAYSEKEELILSNLKDHFIDIKSLRIYIRVFKEEKVLELWAKNSNQSMYKLIKEYPVCSSSGEIGPKRRMGDYQVPEGFYRIDRFNPWSNFYLSLGINYPNKSDQILGEKNNLGGDIFIHGSCVTIGCVPITDDMIKELYIYCIEAYNSGQGKIPVNIFPLKLTQENLKKLTEEYKEDTDKIYLWTDLKKAFDFFENEKKLPTITFLPDGRHSVK